MKIIQKLNLGISFISFFVLFFSCYRFIFDKIKINKFWYSNGRELGKEELYREDYYILIPVFLILIIIIWNSIRICLLTKKNKKLCLETSSKHIKNPPFIWNFIYLINALSLLMLANLFVIVTTPFVRIGASSFSGFMKNIFFGL
ncbi:MAG: hypothetical protein HYR91_06300 [Flavobacteriia bacterium]|nr:hypothetical protein [Flavobacteriia bacterium]